jgi:hypothetical protein
MKKHCDFLHWFVKKSEKFSRVVWYDWKQQWYFSTYDENDHITYQERLTDEELWKQFKTKRDESNTEV